MAPPQPAYHQKMLDSNEGDWPMREERINYMPTPNRLARPRPRPAPRAAHSSASSTSSSSA
ncbi:hypothetical protein FA95DRAFT_1558969 [Auriscalpium vulgare]|uniref:Uncharacterized protein n=1 Tax=Auriscalpium vulgare TaxID=40419 RepID=A0ACB8RVS1_9AGAM|nr:hypothetical protein FA95DRAFT_1558969 [Auriscalpium vulgare]